MAYRFSTTFNCYSKNNCHRDMTYLILIIKNFKFNVFLAFFRKYHQNNFGLKINFKVPHRYVYIYYN
jgi:hypothetical protein